MTTHEGYKWFIDQLVLLSGKDVLATRIRQNGHPIRTNDEDLPLTEDEQTQKDAFTSMTAQQQKIVAALIDDRRKAALHDLACFLEGEIIAGTISMTVNGEALQESPFASFHYDFNCRVEGDAWPKDET